MQKNRSKKVSYESVRKNKKLDEFGGAKMAKGEYDEDEEDNDENNDDDTEPEDEDTNDS